jgi:hypothetical protein
MSLLPVWQPATVDEVVTALADRSEQRLAVRLRQDLLVALPNDAKAALERTAWTFLVAGWSDPILASLPDASRELQIGRELEELTSLGLTDLVGYVPFGWEPQLASLFASNGLGVVAVGSGSTTPQTATVTDHLGQVVQVWPLHDPPPALITADGRPSRTQLPVDREWARTIDGNPEASLLYRKMLRLATRWPDRPPAEAVDLLLEAQASTWYLTATDRTRAHTALTLARRRLDQERRLGSDWTKVSQLDWDADGVGEVQVENRDLSIVIDPVEGLIKTVDLKTTGRPISYLPGEPPWRIGRVLSDGTPTRLPFELEAVEEARDQITLRMSHPDLAVDLGIRDTDLTFDYRPEPGLAYDRLGPELVLAFDHPVRMRVDGGAWLDIGEPDAFPGHRFRFDDGRSQVLVSLAQPGDLFVTGADHGVVVWVNWPVNPGEYRATVSLTG